MRVTVVFSSRGCAEDPTRSGCGERSAGSSHRREWEPRVSEPDDPGMARVRAWAQMNPEDPSLGPWLLQPPHHHHLYISGVLYELPVGQSPSP